jgi:hypothetical protein
MMIIAIFDKEAAMLGLLIVALSEDMILSNI